MENLRGKPVRTIVVLALITSLGGCRVVGPDFIKPNVVVNQSWTTRDAATVTTSATPDAAWWHVFHDPVLDQLIEMAWKQNLPLQTAGLRIAESRAQLALATGQKYPQTQAVFANVTAAGLTSEEARIADSNRHIVTHQVGFDAEWELDFWGRYTNIERAEAAHYFATVADYDSALVSLTAEVARTYAVIRTFEVLIVQAQQNVVVQEEGFRISDSRFRHGATSELDVLQSRTLLESTKATVPLLELSLHQAQNALSTLLGQPTGSVQQILSTSTGIPLAPDAVAVSVPAELLRRRADIRTAELVALEQSARIGIATADLYPRLSLAGTVGLGGTSNGGGIGLFYGVGPRLFLPFFDYGRTRNRIRIEDARFQQALVNYQDTVLRAAQEVEDGLTGYVKSRESAVFATNAVDAARRSTELAFVQYREGAVDFQRVLDAMRALLQEENSLAQTQSDIATNLIALYKSLGGGWELNQGQPVIPEATRQQMEARTRWDDLLTTPPSPEILNDTSREEPKP